MRKSLLIAIATLLTGCPAGLRADSLGCNTLPSVRWLVTFVSPPTSPEEKRIRDLLDIANCNPSLRVRTAALDMLGKLGAKSAAAVPRLKEFLRKPPVEKAEQAFFTLHVVQALANIGSAAQDAIPDLVKVIGIDRNLDNAIDTALNAIQNAPPAKSTTPEGEIDKQVEVLKTEKLAAKRLAAAKSLGDSAKSTDASKVLPPLLDAMRDKDDSQLRRLTAESAKKVLLKVKAIPEASDQYKSWSKTYVEALGTMVAKDRLPDERIFAARALGEEGPTIPHVPTTLEEASVDTTDPDIKAVASNALDKIRGTPKKK
jgi:hypothetical protein